MALEVGLEPTTYRLTADCATITLLKINLVQRDGLEPSRPEGTGFTVRDAANYALSLQIIGDSAILIQNPQTKNGHPYGTRTRKSRRERAVTVSNSSNGWWLCLQDLNL